MSKKHTRIILAGAFMACSSIFTSCYSSQQFVQPSLTWKISATPGYLGHLASNGPERSLALSGRGIDRCGATVDPKSGNRLQLKYAALLCVMPEAICNLSLYHFIDEWYGVRYRLGGDSKKGIDCSAFVQRMYEQVFGTNLLRTAIAQASTSNLIWRKEQCREGDLVFFNVKGSRVSHVGIYLVNNFFVHASSSHGIMISSLEDKYWNKYFACAGRLM